MKICSIVWVGFKTGVKWIDGDISKIQGITQSRELQMLQDEFDSTNNDCTEWDQKHYSEQAVKFLNDHGYKVVYNDFSSGLTESMSEKEADAFVAKLRKSDSTKFKYKKINGEIRKANGTLKKDLLPKRGNVDKARKRHHIPDSVIIYWDLDKDMFRCFKKALFISYI